MRCVAIIGVLGCDLLWIEFVLGSSVDPGFGNHLPRVAFYVFVTFIASVPFDTDVGGFTFHAHHGVIRYREQ